MVEVEGGDFGDVVDDVDSASCEAEKVTDYCVESSDDATAIEADGAEGESDRAEAGGE